MQLPLSFGDISLWLAVTTIILLITSELISPFSERTSLVIEKRQIKQAALLVGTLFIITVLIRVYEII